MDTCLWCNVNFVFNPHDADPICDGCLEEVERRLELDACPCDCGNKEQGIVCYCADPDKLPDGRYSTVGYVGTDPYNASHHAQAYSQYHVNGMVQEEYYWWVRAIHTQQRYKEDAWEAENIDNPRLDGVQYNHFVNQIARDDFEAELESMTFGNQPTQAEWDERHVW